jgi:hypothetical protein
MKNQRGSRGIALLFLQHRRYIGVGGQRHALAALPPGKRPGTHCIGSWVCPRAGLDGCGKSRPHRDSILGPSSLVASSYTDWAIPALQTTVSLNSPHSFRFFFPSTTSHHSPHFCSMTRTDPRPAVSHSPAVPITQSRRFPHLHVSRIHRFSFCSLQPPTNHWIPNACTVNRASDLQITFN